VDCSLAVRLGNLRAVITCELRSKSTGFWDAFWSGGISNPLEVIEQITYLLFIRRLDDIQISKENAARRLGHPLEDPIFLPGDANLRGSRFRSFEPTVMYKTVGEKAFPFLRQLAFGLGEEQPH
jgi:type I restriction enzyme M protein